MDGMPIPRERRPPDDPTGWMSTLWTLIVMIAAVSAATLALPSLPEHVDAQVTARTLFHPEWLIAATFVVLPLYRAARLSWRLALFVVPVACLQVLYIADTAIDASRQVGLDDGVSFGWYAVAFAQVGLFAVVGAVGAYRNLADRRFLRMMQSMTVTGTSADDWSPTASSSDVSIPRDRRPPRSRSG